MTAICSLLESGRLYTKKTEEEQMRELEFLAMLQELMKGGKCIPCMCEDCPGRRPDGTSSNHVKYATVRRGERPHCQACRRAFTCGSCHLVCHIEEKALWPDGVCIDCTRCEYCHQPKWDHVCACQI